MASIRKRHGKWQVQVRLHAEKPISRTFNTKRDAQAWGHKTESEIQLGTFNSKAKELSRTTLGELITKYHDQVTSKKQSRSNESIMLNALLRQKFCDFSLLSISPLHFTAYRDIRRESVKAATINRELDTLSHIYKLARQEWG
ncbi:MAG: site-specific integrase, partial [Rhodospirillaceae bacterium]|nr:site-specific integrase [Rhodospirillaceae bacterium]